MQAFRGAPPFSQLSRGSIKHLSHARKKARKLVHHGVSLFHWFGLASEPAASRFASSECRGEPKQILGLFLGLPLPSHPYMDITAHLHVYHPSWASTAFDWPAALYILSAHFRPVPLPWSLLSKQCFLCCSVLCMSTVFSPFPLPPLLLSITPHSPQIHVIHICVYMCAPNHLNPFRVILGVFRDCPFEIG